MPLVLGIDLIPNEKGLIPLVDLKLPIQIRSLSVISLYDVGKRCNLPVTMEQHLHLGHSLLHTFLIDPGMFIILESTAPHFHANLSIFISILSMFCSLDERPVSIGIFTTPKYSFAKTKTICEIENFLKSLATILWSLYRTEWWRIVMSQFVRKGIPHVELNDFPINNKQIYEFNKGQKGGYGFIGLAKPALLKSIGMFILFSQSIIYNFLHTNHLLSNHVFLFVFNMKNCIIKFNKMD